MAKQPSSQTKPSPEHNLPSNAGRAPAPVEGMTVASLNDLKEVFGGKPQTQYTPPLITKSKFETLHDYYVRAEQSGIGRKCEDCGERRRFSMVACPTCHSHLHRQVKIDKTASEDEASASAQESLKGVTNAIPPEPRVNAGPRTTRSYR